MQLRAFEVHRSRAALSKTVFEFIFFCGGQEGSALQGRTQNTDTKIIED